MTEPPRPSRMNPPHSLLTTLSRLLLAAVVTVSSGFASGPLLLPGPAESHAQTDQSLLPEGVYYVGPYLKTESPKNGPDPHKPLLATIASQEKKGFVWSRGSADFATSIHHVSVLIITQSTSSDL